MKNQFKFTIDDMDMDIDFNDAGPWRSYSLTTFGDNYDDLFDNSYVSETDSDGGEIRTYSLKSSLPCSISPHHGVEVNSGARVIIFATAPSGCEGRGDSMLVSPAYLIWKGFSS